MEDPRVKLVIDRNWEFLRRHLVVTVTMIDRLYEAGIINDYTRHSLIKQTDQAQIATLLGVLRSRSMEVFRKFVTILKLCNDGWIADSLLNTPIQEAWGKGLSRTHGMVKTMREYVDLPISMDISRLADAYVAKTDVLPGLQHRREVDLLTDKYATTALTRPYRSDMQLSTYRPYVPAPPARVSSPYLSSHILPTEYHLPLRKSLSYYDKYASDDLERVPRHVEEVHRAFVSQRLGADKAMAVLKREEIDMKTALETNVRDQAKLYHNQRLLSEIDHRLKQVEVDASHLNVNYIVDPAIRTPWAYKTYRY
ncbi:uncharacterized protein LOC110465306 [Mizuhopecten yessoensis]|uniref:CARD domain-containing protein n=1 Tax=Mizuhopecten yessoensis TaxID=6573 RepID=A0A210PRU1_MIZYE|nr:uncharacterized protein LOC110465306 [Mizuhopecten yessoensis]XP_021376699.1 uncharacterized protein LOC110465306 [Mizuhopecten yessoensis]XP_021376700.1 uncharacterized protein LOC110465306 [Mizuhopecten yessoensis]XP_021376701.1 uncharacterized protein LOC110465306 [Mizuhopecten yessoensis]OWF39215.1 hypothetical protein KP79_PYT20325 [Mizuhopecten yessoensis]